MGNLEPESDALFLSEFEVESSTLEAGDDDRSAPDTPAQLPARLSLKARGWRVAVVTSAFLVLALVLASIPSLRVQAEALLARLAPSPPMAAHEFFLAPAIWPENWTPLEERSLHLPVLPPGSPCPATRGQWVNQSVGMAVGAGPVYAIYNNGSTAAGVLQYGDGAAFGDAGSAWGGQSVMWTIRADARGPVLVRGRQIDGTNDLRFNGGAEQENFVGSWSTAPLLTELRLLSSHDAVSWYYWGSFIRLRAPGCYAYQVDGLSFSYVFVFQAVPEDGP